MIITGHEKFKTQFTKFGLIGKVESEDHGEEKPKIPVYQAEDLDHAMEIV